MHLAQLAVAAVVAAIAVGIVERAAFDRLGIAGVKAVIRLEWLTAHLQAMQQKSMINYKRTPFKMCW